MGAVVLLCCASGALLLCCASDTGAVVEQGSSLSSAPGTAAQEASALVPGCTSSSALVPGQLSPCPFPSSGIPCACCRAVTSASQPLILPHVACG